MGKKERLRRDVAGVGPEPRRTGLSPLRSLKDYQIARGEPDIRGWSVRTLSGSEVGKVDDLLVDAEAGEVVMMDVEMRASERHVQLPIRSAQLDHHAHRVIVDSGDVQRFAALDDVPREDDRSLDRYFDERQRREQQLTQEREARHRDRAHEEEARGVRSRGRDADGIEQEALSPETRADADEVVVERRPVIEEVVIRRRVVED